MALIVAVPLGLIATGTAWGEWGGEELRARIGYVPEGLSRFGGMWKGVLPDYALPGVGGAGAVVVYVLSAVIGVGILAGLAWLLVRARRRRAAAQ